MSAFNSKDVYQIARYRNYIDQMLPNSTQRKNLFLSTCYHLVDDLDIEETCFTNPYGGLIGIGNSRLEKYLGRFKLFQVHAALHDACGYVKRVHGVGPGYVYAMNCPINSCFLGHVTGLSLCLYIKFFRQDIYRIILDSQ